MNVRVRRFTQYPINVQLLYLRQEAWVIQKGRSSGRKRTQMVRHLLGSFWNHFKLWRPHHWYSYTGEILPRRSQEMVHCGACIYYFAMFPLFPSSLNTQFIQRLVPQYHTDSHTMVPFWFSSILSSLGETKNPFLPVSFLSLARASIVADQVFHYDDRRNDRLNMKNKLKHFATHLLVLSSRLFAAALVTASYNTRLWVFFIFAFHYIPMLKCDLVSLHVSWQRSWGQIKILPIECSWTRIVIPSRLQQW